MKRTSIGLEPFCCERVTSRMRCNLGAAPSSAAGRSTCHRNYRRKLQISLGTGLEKSLQISAKAYLSFGRSFQQCSGRISCKSVVSNSMLQEALRLRIPICQKEWLCCMDLWSAFDPVLDPLTVARMQFRSFGPKWKLGLHHSIFRPDCPLVMRHRLMHLESLRRWLLYSPDQTQRCEQKLESQKATSYSCRVHDTVRLGFACLHVLLVS